MTYWTTLQKGGHGSAEESIRVPHLQEISVLGLREDSEIDSRHILVPGITDRSAVLHELERGELL